MTSLVDPYDLVIFDLDGVVFIGDHPISSAVEALTRLRDMGKAVRFATNNASRRPDEVARLLVGMGVAATADEVLTSGTAAAAALARRCPPGAPVLVVGTAGLRADVAAAGLTPVLSADEDPVAVVQGFGPEVGWAQLAEACVAVRAGAFWAATNIDRTLPTPRGMLPGNGSLVAVLSTALDRRPDLVVGKPEPELFLCAARDTGSLGTLVIGDRLDTDIAGARRAGMDSLLVLTGVATAASAAAARPDQRPNYVVRDLSMLFAVA